MINQFLLWIGTIVFVIAYLKMRDKIPTYKRDKIEMILMALIVVLLLIDISYQVIEVKLTTEKKNDCIRFYRYYTHDSRDVDFNFIQDCYDELGSEKINSLKKSGVLWQQDQNKLMEVNQDGR